MAHLSEIDNVPAFDQVEIRHFFEVYKASEPGKSVEASGAVSGNVRPASSRFAGAES
jgi:inorganic pyrophosphatase